jgi:hypothetical protein
MPSKSSGSPDFALRVPERAPGLGRQLFSMLSCCGRKMKASIREAGYLLCSPPPGFAPNRACRRMLRPRPVPPTPAGAAIPRMWNSHSAPNPCAVIRITHDTVAPAHMAPPGDTLPACLTEMPGLSAWVAVFPIPPTWRRTKDPTARPGQWGSLVSRQGIPSRWLTGT